MLWQINVFKKIISKFWKLSITSSFHLLYIWKFSFSSYISKREVFGIFLFVALKVSQKVKIASVYLRYSAGSPEIGHSVLLLQFRVLSMKYEYSTAKIREFAKERENSNLKLLTELFSTSEKTQFLLIISEKFKLVLNIN